MRQNQELFQGGLELQQVGSRASVGLGSKLKQGSGQQVGSKLWQVCLDLGTGHSPVLDGRSQVEAGPVLWSNPRTKVKAIKQGSLIPE